MLTIKQIVKILKFSAKKYQKCFVIEKNVLPLHPQISEN